MTKPVITFSRSAVSHARSRALSAGVAVVLTALLCACAQKGGSSAGGHGSRRSGDATSVNAATSTGSKSGRSSASAGGTSITGPGARSVTRAGDTTLTGPGGTTVTRPDGTTLTGPGGTTVTRPDGTTLTGPGGTIVTRPDGTTLTGPGGAQAAGSGRAGASSAAAGGWDRDGDGIPDYADSDEAEGFEGLAGESGGTRWGRDSRSTAGMAGGAEGADADWSQSDGDSSMDYTADEDGDADGMDADMANADGSSSADGSKSGARGARRSARAGKANRSGAGGDAASLAGDSNALDGQSAVAGADGRDASGRRSGRPGGRNAMAGDGSGEDSDAQDSAVVGMVDAPGNHVRVDEEVTAQTLGGMLPLVLGVDEQGEFDFDQAVLRPEVQSVLDELAGKLADAEYDRLDIVGYTDRIGTKEYNQSLSERRAWAVARYLFDKGVPLDKLRVEGRGERESMLQQGECADLAREQLIPCLQRDRRVQIEASIRKSTARVQ